MEAEGRLVSASGDSMSLGGHRASSSHGPVRSSGRVVL
jgi:hypothetical protein